MRLPAEAWICGDRHRPDRAARRAQAERVRISWISWNASEFLGFLVCLIAAIKLCSTDRVTTLLNRDSTLVNRPTSGMLPLYTAIQSQQPEMVALLLARGADLDLPQTPGGATARDEALKTGDAEIETLLSQPR